MIPLKTNSAEINGPEDIFLALNGHCQDGHDFIPDAVRRGARAVIAQRNVPVPEGVRLLVVPDTYQYLKDYLISRYRPVLHRMKLIGITGTNGKTTSCYLIYQLLLGLSVKCAYIGTVGFYLNGERRPLNNTTPDIRTLYQLLLEAEEAGCEAVVMEVSSHALAQERIAGLSFDVTGFTNLSQDHLDYHGDMQTYFSVKRQILSYLKEDGTMLANRDDPYFTGFLTPRTLLFGSEGSDLMLKECRFSRTKTQISFALADRSYTVSLGLPGMINVYNYLLAVGAVYSLGFPMEAILPLCPGLKPPAGRLQTLPVKNGLAVIDYAHNPDAVYRVLHLYRNTAPGRILTVLGSAGDRDRTKRPLMGQIAAAFSDRIFFTNDDPHSENPRDILADLTKKLTGHASYLIEPNRRKAIFLALDEMQPGDTVLILGKGHEEFIQYRDRKIPHSDLMVVEEYIRTFASKTGNSRKTLPPPPVRPDIEKAAGSIRRPS